MVEVGKFYVVRNPKTTGIVKVRVDAIRHDMTEKDYIVACSVFNEYGIFSREYSLDGNHLLGARGDSDLVAEYIDPNER